MNQPRTFFSLVILITVFLICTPEALAASCCLCSHPAVANGKFCLNNVNTSCENLNSSTNNDVKAASCVTDVSANPCKKIPAGQCLNEPSSEIDFKLSSVPGYVASKSADTQPKTLDFKLNIDLPGLTFFAPYNDNNTVIVPMMAQYLQAFQALLIGISLIATAIMLIYGGWLYLLSGTGLKVQEGKKIIIDALIGMIIVLGAVVILSNLNPNTARLTALQLYRVPAEKSNIETVSTVGSSGSTKPGKCTFEMNPGGQPTLLSIYHCAADVLSKDLNINPCYIFTAMNNESYMALPNIAGHDENPIGPVRGTGMSIYPGRKRFNELGVTYKGKPVIPDVTINDDVVDYTKDDLGLDPRFSHGFGLMMFTFSVNKSGKYSFDGEPFTPKQLMDPYWGMYFGSLHIRRTLRTNNAFDTQKLLGTISMVWIYYGGCYNKDGSPGPCAASNKNLDIKPMKPVRMGTPDHRNNDTYWCMQGTNIYENINPIFLTVCRGDFPLDPTECQAFVEKEIVPLKPDINPKFACSVGCWDKRMPVVGDAKSGYKYRNK
ncbi:MAG: pilin [Patescibacteria group bacterium]|jgi:hypothetical protein